MRGLGRERWCCQYLEQLVQKLFIQICIQHGFLQDIRLSTAMDLARRGAALIDIGINRVDGRTVGYQSVRNIPKREDVASAEALYRLGAWRFGPNVRWMPVSTPTDHANTPGAEQDAYALLGLKLEWREGPWAVFLQADNVTDRRYFITGGFSQIYPQAW